MTFIPARKRRKRREPRCPVSARPRCARARNTVRSRLLTSCERVAVSVGPETILKSYTRPFPSTKASTTMGLSRLPTGSGLKRAVKKVRVGRRTQRFVARRQRFGSREGPDQNRNGADQKDGAGQPCGSLEDKRAHRVFPANPPAAQLLMRRAADFMREREAQPQA